MRLTGSFMGGWVYIAEKPIGWSAEVSSKKIIRFLVAGPFRLSTGISLTKFLL